MAKVGNLDANLEGSFEFFFVMTYVGTLYTNLRGYFELPFIMAEVGNLDAKLGVTLYSFHNDSGGHFFYKLQ
jgi:hypothetical protein